MAQLLLGQQGAGANSQPPSPPSPPSYLCPGPSTPPSAGTPRLLADLPAPSATWQPRDAGVARRGTWGCGEPETPRLFIWLPFCGFPKVPAGLQEKLLQEGPRPVPGSSAGPAGAAAVPGHWVSLCVCVCERVRKSKGEQTLQRRVELHGVAAVALCSRSSARFLASPCSR